MQKIMKETKISIISQTFISLYFITFPSRPYSMHIGLYMSMQTVFTYVYICICLYAYIITKYTYTQVHTYMHIFYATHIFTIIFTLHYLHCIYILSQQNVQYTRKYPVSVGSVVIIIKDTEWLLKELRNSLGPGPQDRVTEHKLKPANFMTLTVLCWNQQWVAVMTSVYIPKNPESRPGITTNPTMFTLCLRE